MRGKIPHIVQYQGSKRILAPQIYSICQTSLIAFWNRFPEWLQLVLLQLMITGQTHM